MELKQYIISKIQSQLDSKNICGMLLLELRKSCDTVKHEILLVKLYCIGLRGRHGFKIISITGNNPVYTEQSKFSTNCFMWWSTKFCFRSNLISYVHQFSLWIEFMCLFICWWHKSFLDRMQKVTSEVWKCLLHNHFVIKFQPYRRKFHINHLRKKCTSYWYIL